MPQYVHNVTETIHLHQYQKQILFLFCSLDACIFLFLQRLPKDAHFLFLFYKIFVILALLRSLIKLIRFVHISIKL